MEDIIEIVLKPVVIRTINGFEFLCYDDIVRFEADGNNTLIYTITKTSPIRSGTKISYFEKRYPFHSFYRCHRSHIINLNYITSFNRKLKLIILREEHIIPISNKYLSHFLNRLFKMM
jgi:two-component system LytT family response regulator